MPPWTAANVPNLTGRSVIVTGSNSGLGFETALQLARHGATVTLAVRDQTKGDQAASAMRANAPGIEVHVGRLDVSDLDSVRTFAKAWSSEHPQGLDLLINNAGIMATPQRKSAQGFEMQLATNHLGHFALTGLLFPALVAVPNSRVVNVSSLAHRMVKGFNFQDPMGTKKYRAWGAYGQSKLANLLFTTEFSRRLELGDYSVGSVAAHPGFSATNLQGAASKMRGNSVEFRVTQLMNSVIAQSAEMGALPILFAATAPGLPNDSFVGPADKWQTRGYPTLVDRTDAAKDPLSARRLWDWSEEITGVSYPF
jgi:NAD(P)-dependent dehydrogenase (short-subunit alcohol dehydrogenase family)